MLLDQVDIFKPQAKTVMKRAAHTKTETVNKLIVEFMTTEQNYCDQLTLATGLWIFPLRAHIETGTPILEEKELDCCFQNLAELAEISKRLINQFQTMLIEGTFLNSAKFADYIIRMAPFLKIYSMYASGFEKAGQEVVRLKELKTSFANFNKRSEIAAQLSGNGLTLSSLLITPIQRIPRYVLLLKEMVKETAENDPDSAKLEKALEEVSSTAEKVDHAITLSEASQRLFNIQTLCSPPFELVSPNRAHVKDGQAKKKYNKTALRSKNAMESIWLFLFNDAIMYSTIPGANKKIRVKQFVSLNGLLISYDPDPLNTECRIMWVKKNVTIVFADPEERWLWLCLAGLCMGLLANTIRQPESIPMTQLGMRNLSVHQAGLLDACKPLLKETEAKNNKTMLSILASDAHRSLLPYVKLSREAI